MTNEKRLIDANALKEQVMKEIRHYWNYGEGGYYLAEDVVPDIDNAPTVDAVEVVHARWVYNGRSDEYFCSNCYKQPISFRREMNCGVGEFVEVCFSDCCPNCGAKMDGGNDDG